MREQLGQGASAILIIMDAMDRLISAGLMGKDPEAFGVSPGGELKVAELKAAGFTPTDNDIAGVVKNLAREGTPSEHILKICKLVRIAIHDPGQLEGLNYE